MVRHCLDQIRFSVWITNSKGERLNEFPLPGQAMRTGNRDTIECWIPATAGEEFAIHWKTDYERPNLHSDRDLDYGGSNRNDRRVQIPRNKLRDLRCKIWLDGDEREPGFLDAKSIYQELEDSGTKDGEVDEDGYFRPYKFGKLPLTDDDRALSSNGFYTNRIEVELEWGTTEELDYWDTLPPPNSPIVLADIEPVHERKVKLGNCSVSGFGEPVVRLGASGDASGEKELSFTKEKGATSQRFVFHHAEKAWLMAKGIIPWVGRMESIPQPPRPRVGPRTRAQTQTETHPHAIVHSEKQPQSKPTDTKKNTRQETNETEEIKPKLGHSNHHDLQGLQIDLTYESDSDDELATMNDSPAAKRHTQPRRSGTPYRISRSQSYEPPYITSLRPFSMDSTRSTSLKRAFSPEVIELDTSSDSESQIDVQRDSKANVFDSKSSASNTTRTYVPAKEIAYRRPRRISGPNKQARNEQDEVKFEESNAETAPEGAEPTAPPEEAMEVDTKPDIKPDIKPDTNISQYSDDEAERNVPHTFTFKLTKTDANLARNPKPSKKPNLKMIGGLEPDTKLKIE